MHIPKTGGTSVETALLPWTEAHNECQQKVLIGLNHNPFRGPPRLQHLTASEYVRCGHVSSADWKQYLSFSVVRNPWARMVSEYNYRGRTRTMKMARLKWDFRNFVKFGRPRWYEANYLRGTTSYRHVLSQWRFLCNRRGDRIVDEIVKLEDFKHGVMDNVLGQIDLQGLEIPRANQSVQRDPKMGSKIVEGKRLGYRDYYDSELKDIIAKRYRKDIAMFGYDF